MDPVIDPLHTWTSDRERAAAAQSQQQDGEAAADAVMGTTILFIVMILCLTFIVLGV
jgi:hypothetical protein